MKGLTVTKRATQTYHFASCPSVGRAFVSSDQWPSFSKAPFSGFGLCALVRMWMFSDGLKRVATRDVAGLLGRFSSFVDSRHR